MIWNDTSIPDWYRQNIIVYAPVSQFKNHVISNNSLDIIHPDLWKRRQAQITASNNHTRFELYKKDNMQIIKPVRDLILRTDNNYFGKDSETYEQKRNTNKKWNFENTCLKSTLQNYCNEINTIIDAPIGTGRFIDLYQEVTEKADVIGIDSSNDMLNIAQKKIKTNKIKLLNVDLRNISNEIQGDLVVCYRLFNLICRESFLQIFENILKISKKYVIFSIRIFETEHIEEIKIEDKIYIRNMSDVESTLIKNNFTILKEYSFKDSKPGVYKILFCKSENLSFNNCRINKAFRIIYNYKESGVQKKIYQVKNEKHANFIFNITCKNTLDKLFPKIYKIEKNFIHSEWIDGELTQTSAWDEIIELLIKIQRIETNKYSSFDYVEDLIIPRFYLATPVIGLDFYKMITSLIFEGGKQEQLKVSVPRCFKWVGVLNP